LVEPAVLEVEELCEDINIEVQHYQTLQKCSGDKSF